MKNAAGEKRSSRLNLETSESDNQRIDYNKAIEIVTSHTDTRLAYLDRDFKIIWVNPSYARGVGLKPADMIGRNHFDLFPNPTDKALLQKIMQTGREMKIHDRPFRLRKLGITYWDVSIAPVKNSVGYIEGLVLSVVSTTRRKMIEMQLELAAREWGDTVDSIPDFVSIHDSDHRIVKANHALATALKMKPEDITGHLCYELLHKTHEPWPSCPFTRTKEFQETFSDEFFEPNLNLHLEIITSPIFDKQHQLIGCVHVARNVTDRKIAENDLIESEIRSRIITENMDSGVLLFEQGKGVYANQRAADILGYSKEELLNMKPVDLVAPEDRGQFLQMLLEKTMSGKSAAVIDHWLLCKGGDRRFIRTHYCPINESGRPSRIFHIFTDITELKLTEMKLQDLYKTELELHQKLENEIQKRINFSNALVHELKTPLTPILSSSEMLIESLKENLQLRLAKNIQEGANDLDHRVDELLELARIEVGSLKLNLHPVNILKLICDTVNYMQPELSRKGQSLIYRLPESLPNVIADSQRLKQILVNLIINAHKYTPSGSAIVISARRKGSNIVVEVQDNGPGLNERDQEHLFEPYFRVERDRDNINGLGLGLPLSKHIIEMHHGKIWIKSQVGKGSTFCFSLPIQSQPLVDKHNEYE